MIFFCYKTYSSALNILTAFVILSSGVYAFFIKMKDEITNTFINTTPNVANVSYLWKVDDGSTSRETNFTYKFTSIGIYEVSLTATAGGCSSGAVYPLGNRDVNKIRVNINYIISNESPFNNNCDRG
jgi:hypothetical protein